MGEADAGRNRPYAGGCLCGALRYEATGEPVVCGHCYCEDCRKATGSGFIPFMVFPASTIRFSGEAAQIVTKAANGNDSTRNFCPRCGGLVFGGVVGHSTSHTIYAGSLDEPARFRPTVTVFTRGRPEWAMIPPGIEVHERGY
jgi:hypothetical protein